MRMRTIDAPPTVRRCMIGVDGPRRRGAARAGTLPAFGGGRDPARRATE
jgi:hypothetical protein